MKKSKDKVSFVAYTRYSSTNQREASNEQQKSIIQDYADKHNINIEMFFQDSAVSGTSTKDRDGLERMLEYVENHPHIKGVICHKLDRLSRDIGDYHNIRKRLARCGAYMVFVSDNLSTNDSYSIMQEAIMGGVAQMYSENLGREVMRGLKYNASCCISTGGTPPLGYNIDIKTKKLIINEDEAKIVELIFERYGEYDFSYGEIANELNKKGYKTKMGNDFSKGAIRDILKNEKYIGTYTYNKRAAKDVDGKRNNSKMKPANEIIRKVGGCPRIISDELWEKVQKRLSDKNHKSYSTKHHYLLKDKIYCGECGAKMGGNHKSSGGNKKRYTTYDCNGRKSKKDCMNKGINAKYIEKFVLRQIMNMFMGKSVINKLTLQVNEYMLDENNTWNSSLKAAEKRAKATQTNINRLLDSIQSGISPNIVAARLSELDSQKRMIQGQIKELKRELSKRRVKKSEIKEALSKFFDVMTSDELVARRVIQKYVEKVVVYDDKIELILNTYREFKKK